MNPEGRITCEIPITLKIGGTLDNDVLIALEERLVGVLRRRMREAVQLAEANDATVVISPTEALREAYDPDRHDPAADTYAVRSYRGGGRPTGMRLTRRRRRWYVPRGQVFTAYVKLSS